MSAWVSPTRVPLRSLESIALRSLTAKDRSAELAAAAAIRHAAAAAPEDTTASDLVEGLQQMW